MPFANHPERYATLWDLRFFGRIRCFFFGWKNPRRSFWEFFLFEGFRVWKAFLQKPGIQWSNPIHIYTNQPHFQRGRNQKKTTLGSWCISPGFGMVFWDTWALSRIPGMVVRKHGRLYVASRFVRSDQAKIIILVLADETYSRFVMTSPMFSANHRKVDWWCRV